MITKSLKHGENNNYNSKFNKTVLFFKFTQYTLDYVKQNIEANNTSNNEDKTI